MNSMPRYVPTPRLRRRGHRLMYCKRAGLAAVSVSACFVPRFVRADLVNWSAGATGNWNVAANWTVAGQPANQHVPGSGDTAAIANAIVSLTGNLYSVFGLNLTNAGLSTGTLNVSGTSTFAGTNTLDGVVLNANGGGSGSGTIRFQNNAALNIANGQTLALNNSVLAFKSSGGSISGNVAFSNVSANSLFFDGVSGNPNTAVTYGLGANATFSGRLNNFGNSFEQFNGNATTLNTAATFNLNNAGTTTLLGATNAGVETVNNSGTFNISGGNNLTVNATAFTNTGSVTQNTGTLTLSTLFTNNTGAGLTTTNGGTLAVVNGTLVDTGNTTALSNLSLNSGTLLNGILNVSGTSTFAGTNTLDGVVLNANGGGSGSGTIRFQNNAALNIANGQTLALNNSVLAFKSSGGSISGNVAFSNVSANSLFFDGVSGNPNTAVTYGLGATATFSGRLNGIGNSYDQYNGNVVTLNTAATFNLNNAGTTTLLGATNAGVETVNNSGTFNISGGNNLTVNATAFTNTGNINIANGSTATFTTGATQTAGKTIVNGAATINASSIFAVQGGVLEGNGTITGAVSNTGGVVTAGGDTSAGKLTETGNYTQGASGVFLTKLGGTGQGTSYDLFSVSGAAAFSGQLQVQLLNGFAPTVGQTFNIITYGSHTGTFSSIFSLDPGYAYNVNYTNNVAILGVTAAAVPETGTLVSLGLLMAGGAFALKRTRRRDEKASLAASPQQS